MGYEESAMHEEGPKGFDKDRLAFFVLTAAYVGWALYYIHRTSVEMGGERIYTLWDDAMISMRYARNWVEGHGLTWNPGERVMGFSNLGVTLLMVPVHLLLRDPRLTSFGFQLVCLAALLGSALVVGRLTRALYGDDPWPARAASLLFMWCAPLQVLGLQGTDVPFVTLSLLLALLHAVRGWPLATWLWLAVAMVLRIDMAVFFALAIVNAARQAETRPAALRGVAILALTSIACAGFAWAYYGDPLPNTYYLKATGQPRLRMLLTGIAQLGPIALRASPLIAMSLFRTTKQVRLVLAMALGFVVYDVWVGGDWIPEYVPRFAAPALALLVVTFAGGAWRLMNSVGLSTAGGEYRAPSPARRRDIFFSASLLAIPLLSTPEALHEWLSPSAPTMHEGNKRESLALARFLRDHTEPTLTVAVHWGGIQPYFSRRRAFDVLGKTDSHIAHLTVDRYEPGHSKWDWPYVLEHLAPDLFDGETRGLGALPAFREHYCELRVPGEVPLVLYLRAGSESKIHPPVRCNSLSSQLSSPVTSP